MIIFLFIVLTSLGLLKTRVKSGGAESHCVLNIHDWWIILLHLKQGS